MNDKSTSIVEQARCLCATKQYMSGSMHPYRLVYRDEKLFISRNTVQDHMTIMVLHKSGEVEVQREKDTIIRGTMVFQSMGLIDVDDSTSIDIRQYNPGKWEQYLGHLYQEAKEIAATRKAALFEPFDDSAIFPEDG